MSKKLDSIPADVEIMMTEDLIRAFKLEGCNPKCHCCGEVLASGCLFKLAYITTVDSCSKINSDWKPQNEDEMLCDKCSAADLIRCREQIAEDALKRWNERRRGYTRLHINN